MGYKINKAKHEFYKNSFQLFKSNAKKSWNLLNNLMGKKKSKHEDIEPIVGSDKIVKPFAGGYLGGGARGPWPPPRSKRGGPEYHLAPPRFHKNDSNLIKISILR